MPWMSASWKPSVPIMLPGHLPGDRDDRHRVHVRVRDRRDQVGRARTGGRHADADPAGGLRVPGGGVAGALLVADQDVPHRRVEQRVVGRQDGAARDAEDYLYAERLERLDERAGAGRRQLLSGRGVTVGRVRILVVIARVDVARPRVRLPGEDFGCRDVHDQPLLWRDRRGDGLPQRSVLVPQMSGFRALKKPSCRAARGLRTLSIERVRLTKYSNAGHALTLTHLTP